MIVVTLCSLPFFFFCYRILFPQLSVHFIKWHFWLHHSGELWSSFHICRRKGFYLDYGKPKPSSYCSQIDEEELNDCALNYIDCVTKKSNYFCFLNQHWSLTLFIRILRVTNFWFLIIDGILPSLYYYDMLNPLCIFVGYCQGEGNFFYLEDRCLDKVNIYNHVVVAVQ